MLEQPRTAPPPDQPPEERDFNRRLARLVADVADNPDPADGADPEATAS